MSDAQTLRDRAYQAIEGMARPVTQENVLRTVKPLLPAKEYGDFVKWFDKNGAALMGRLNG